MLGLKIMENVRRKRLMHHLVKKKLNVFTKVMENAIVKVLVVQIWVENDHRED